MQKILIVEDDNKIANLLKAYLENSDFSVAVANSGHETRKILESASLKDFSAVILDLMLPDLEGEILLQEIKEAQNIPVIILSAKSQIEDKLTGLSLG
ncbi:MAG: response regulator, partial [Clostridia bacterium]|nr:response regulator [Clostridia bacterium]